MEETSAAGEPATSTHETQHMETREGSLCSHADYSVSGMGELLELEFLGSGMSFLAF